MQNSFPYGRQAPLSAIGELLTAAKNGRGGALVLAGGPGEGRTTLLRAAGPSPLTLLVEGHADESGLALSGLQRLLEPLAGLVGDLPARQREPLDDVIAGRPPAPGPLTLGVSVLALLRRAARRGPLLLLIDDADRLDPQSWQQFRLVARRLHSLPVAVLATVTADDRGLALATGLPLIRLTPLDETASRALLRRCAPDLAPEVAAALTDLAAGHPGALTDLAGALTPAQRRGFAAPPCALPPGSTLRRHGNALMSVLPAVTRRLLLLAATDPDATPADLVRAANLRVDAHPSEPAHSSEPAHLSKPAQSSDPAHPGDDVRPPERATMGDGARLADLEPAERAGLIEVSPSGVRFTPEVLRTVVYGDAPIALRHEAHASLAAALAERGHRLGALLHRAAVTTGADDDLARDLLEAAQDAPSPEAFRARRYAAGLSSDPRTTAEAALAAARSALAAGRPRDAAPLLRRAGHATGQAVVRARARALIAELHARGAPAESRDTLLGVAAETMSTDPAAALDALVVAGEACGRTGEPGLFPPLARQAADRCRDGRPGTELAVQQVLGVADLLTGDEEGGFGHLREVVRLGERSGDATALIRAADAGIVVGDDDRAARLAGRAVTLAREIGDASLVPRALEVAAYAELAAGRHDAAHEHALDGAATARHSDLADAHLALLGLLAAFRGDAATAREHAAGSPLEDWSEALLDLVEGEPARAAQRLVRVARTGSMVLRVAVAPHLVETTGAGNDVFDRWAGRTGRPGWLALRGRCRALTDIAAADDWFREALGWHERDADGGYARAHTQLLYGRHLRRRRRPAEAREHLRRAVETFRRFDAGPWAGLAARELRAAGERIGPVGRAPLTAQQERIAELVAEGATNREVAQQLHLSPRTIDHHLRNVFARLGVRSRTELARLDLFHGDRGDQFAIPVADHAQ
ncbi:helix-turn-helix transcriptional regulator [Paractinoplanes abujensis]|uniref:DNA-binding CsgD family transcriptional regulator n=1 Tax=Paractinoplanes abujensis TaxID=882441 RepID=A0A7W7G1S1_9ACTN|nr:DNA-binding CsgD family transcriptional regulator [Actinoplanes abujensis]GID17661.1 helix-turn-helix transcriptional regulator [Actinoplanes abujensis]